LYRVAVLRALLMLRQAQADESDLPLAQSWQAQQQASRLMAQ
jgi:hypothetical protein